MSRVNGPRVVAQKRAVADHKLYSVREAADVLGVKPSTVRAYVKSGALKVTHELSAATGGEKKFLRFSSAELQRFVDAHCVRGDQDPDGGVF